MNNITLAHIGGELVLIGGVAFYFHRKTNLLQEEVSTLKYENKELSDAVEDLQDGLQQLTALVMQLQQQLGLRPRVSQPSQAPPPQQPQSQPQPQQRETFKPVQTQQVPQPQPQPQLLQPNPAQLQGMMNMMQGLIPGMPQQDFQTPVTFPSSSGGRRQKKQRKGRKPKSDSEDSGEETYDDKDLDRELAGEYQQLAQERQKGVNCAGESCQLIE